MNCFINTSWGPPLRSFDFPPEEDLLTQPFNVGFRPGVNSGIISTKPIPCRGSLVFSLGSREAPAIRKNSCRCGLSDSKPIGRFCKGGTTKQEMEMKARGIRRREGRREEERMRKGGGKTWSRDCGQLHKLAQPYQQHFMVFWNSFKGNSPLCAAA